MSLTTSSEGQGRKRPWLAAALAVVYPGLGHVYLRQWGRALLWFALIFGTTWLFVPDAARVSTLSVDALVESIQAIPLTVRFTLLLFQVLNIADAYWLARRTGQNGAGVGGSSSGRSDAGATNGDSSPTADEGQTCPNCGKELDGDIDFCHWCTTRLDESDAGE